MIYTNPTDTGYKMEERYIGRNRLKTSAYIINPGDYFFKYNGPYKSFDKKGHKIKDAMYYQGKPTGVCKSYYPGTDTLWDQITYGENGSYALISYYKDGKIKRKEDSVTGHSLNVCVMMRMEKKFLLRHFG